MVWRFSLAQAHTQRIDHRAPAEPGSEHSVAIACEVSNRNPGLEKLESKCFFVGS